MNAYPQFLEKSTHKFVKWIGTSQGFTIAVSILFLWILSGQFLGYSNTWLSTFNTFTSIITFLMIFLMQRSQSKEFQALQIKLNELIVAQKNARNELINIEASTEERIEAIHKEYERVK